MIDSTHFRTVLGHFASGVTVITALDEGAPVGFTCQSFSSLSLDPPLVLFCPAASSSTWPRIRRAGSFCANVLAADQEQVGRTFARSGTEKFAGITWTPSSRTGSPVLPDVVAWVDCEIEREVEGGDHVVVIGRVLELDVARDTDPLLFFKAGFGRFAN